jgi:subtilisin family serine protease|tara:strand:+ start:16799 stop:19921 length:3123 start_codon:yes stop_codon:yes gene_type:complete
MKIKKYLIILSIGIFFLSLISSINNPGNLDKKIDKDVLDKFEKEEKVEVIIQLKDKSLIEKKPGINIFSNKQVKTSYNGIKIDHKFKDSFTTTISKDELDNLKLDDDVLEIIKSKEVHLFLQDSVGIMNATPSWPIQISGTNITGVDETICVIDTGINYTNADFGGCSNESFLDGTCSKVIGGWDFNTGTEDNDPMDYNGHGTHVAGTVAANGNITGIAPDAKIVAVKVFDDGGSGGNQLVIADAVQWCVDNSSIYNISVITMSLGFADNQTGYCDSDPSYSGNIVVAINNAIAKNITVTVATGNDYNYTAISPPACIENATSVGATDKSDNFASYSNRNNITDLFATGSNINSTKGTCLSGCSCSGNYMTCSGTSMATPHVAGAFALIRQFYRLQSNRVLLPSEIESSLNNTGVILNDSSTGLNFSRIDIYSSILSLDETSPNVTLITPTNATINPINNQSFSCNATDEFELSNITFYLWNSSNDLINQTLTNVSGTFNETSWNVTNLAYDSYKWNCEATDSNNSAYATSNFSLTIGNLSISLNSPTNNTFTNQNQTFNCNASSSNNLINSTFYIWNSSASLIYNETKNTSGTSNNTNFNYNFTYEDSFKWNCLFYNNINLQTYAESNFTVTYDLTLPILNTTSPINNSWYNAGRFNVTINESGNCTYSLNSGINNVTMSSLNSLIFNSTNSSLSATNSSNDYNVIFYCNDSSNNKNLSSLIFFGIDLTYPNITLISPDTSSSYTSSSQSITFNYNVTDNINISSCNLIIDNATSLTNSTITNQSDTQSFTKSFSPGNYNWQINCTDLAGNLNNSISRSFSVTAPSNPGSSGGSGGSSISISTIQTHIPSNEQTSIGYTKELNKNDKIKFTFFDRGSDEHSLTLNQIGDDFINITIQSDPIKVVLGIGQSIKLNLTSPDYYDLYVKLEDIISNKAKITIQTINEQISGNPEIIKEIIKDNETDKDFEEQTKEIKKNIKFLNLEIIKLKTIIYISIPIFIIIVIFILITRKRRIKLMLKKQKKNEATKTKRKRKKKVSSR